MSQKVNTCVNCNSTKLNIIKEHNPDTNDLNMKVDMKCNDCGHIDIYKIMSYKTRKKWKKGWIKI